MKPLLVIVLLALFGQATAQAVFTKKERDSINLMIDAKLKSVATNFKNLSATDSKLTIEIAEMRNAMVSLDTAQFNTIAGKASLKTNYLALYDALRKEIATKADASALLSKIQGITDTALIKTLISDAVKVLSDKTDAQYRAIYKADSLIRMDIRKLKVVDSAMYEVCETIVDKLDASDSSLLKISSDVNTIFQLRIKDTEEMKLIQKFVQYKIEAAKKEVEFITAPTIEK